MTKVLIVGATSAIAQEVARCFTQHQAELFLVARRADRLAAVGDDLRVRGARRVETMLLDVTDLGRHQELVDTAIATLGGLDTVLIAHGTLGDQRACERNVSAMIKELTTNCLSILSLSTILANYFEQQQRGCLAVITSVAGDRGRQSNYVYGTAKGAVSIFLQGLRNRLSRAGVSVVTLKLGLVDTPMTAAMEKNVLFASPQRVGRSIYLAMRKGNDVAYIPWFWRPIMALLRSVPEPLFKRLTL